jgi:predicted NBD/HSP70 family sugar kinase
MGGCLGLGIGNLMALFDPAMVVLAGRTTAGTAHFMPAVVRETERLCWPQKSRKVLVSQLGESAAAMGACGVILQAAFEPEGMEGEKMAG